MLLAGPAAALSEDMRPIANYVLLSNDYGGRTYIGLPLVGRETPSEPIEAFPAKAQSGNEIAALFNKLCLTKPFDRQSFDASASAAGFSSFQRDLPDFSAPRPLLGVDKVPGTQIVQSEAANGIASLWLGDGVEGLAKRQYLRYSGSLVIIGPVKAQDFYAPQCNLTVRVSGLNASNVLLDAVQETAVGFDVIKRVDKPKYGYAIWTRSSDDGRAVRIRVDADDLNKSQQTVHLTVQKLPLGKVK